MNGLSLRVFLLVLLAACGQGVPAPARAATANVSCSTIVVPVNFSAVAPISTATVQANGSIQFSCTNVSLLAAQNVTLCLGLGLGQGSGTSITPVRQMNGPASSVLAFQLYQTSSSSPVWGNVPSTSNPPPMVLQFTIPISVLGLPTTYSSPVYPVYGSLVTPQAAAVSGSYSNALNGSLTYQANNAPLLGTNYPATCDGGASNAFTLAVQASVANQCTVSAGSTLSLGSVPSTATNIAGNNAINVTCTSNTPYYVGLAPSNGNTAGAGVMSGTGSNADQVPYQLRSTAGSAGAIWGNTATAGSVGNGVQGSGSGVGQPITVYATVPSANYTPDTYTDTVTVNVNY